MWKGLKHECRHWYRGKPQSWVRKEGAHHCFHYVGAGCHIPYILVARNPANGQFHKLSCVSGWGGGWGWDWHSKLLTADMSLGMPWLFMAWGSGRALNARSFSRQRRKSPAYLWLVKKYLWPNSHNANPAYYKANRTLGSLKTLFPVLAFWFHHFLCVINNHTQPNQISKF